LTDLLCANDIYKASVSFILKDDTGMYYFPTLIQTPDNIFYNNPKEIKHHLWMRRFHLARGRQSLLTFLSSATAYEMLPQKRAIKKCTYY
ncbi:MAG: hypothetical protein LBS54_02120, partial [Dysgonamonadaceae bacterium]|nr:hypothetical protein [Dysgonamonadaceae bacterium]